MQLQILESSREFQAALRFFSAHNKIERVDLDCEVDQIDPWKIFQTDNFAFHYL